MDGLPVVFVRAKKEVFSGDEVTYDYGSFMITSNMNIQKCLCATNNCRHIVTIDNDETNDMAEEESVVEALFEEEYEAVVAEPDVMVVEETEQINVSYAGIVNNSDILNGICYFSASIQFLFRGISKKKFKIK